MTREKRAIQILEQRACCMECVVPNCTCAECDESFELAIKALEQESRWIPVSERLPNSEYGESDSVLVCFENETQDVLYFDGSNWCYPTGETYISVNHKNDWHNKVVAWMPLPKAYREKQSNKVGWSSLENVREKVERGTEK